MLRTKQLLATGITSKYGRQRSYGGLIRSTKGSAMVLGFFALLLVSAFGISLISLATNSVGAAKRDVLRARALACAEAGIDMAISFLMEGGPNGEEPGTFRTSHPSSDPDNHTSDVMYTFSLAQGDTTRVCVHDGTGLTAGRIVITSFGTATDGGRSATRTIKVVVRLNEENVNVWNNAIFAATGQAGKCINGNVAIRGSVHLLGDAEEFTDLDGDQRWDDNEPYTDSNKNGKYDLGEPFADVDGDGHRDSREPFVDVNGNGTRDPALTVTDLATEISGDAEIGNNYSGMPSELLAKLPPLEKVLYGGELVDSLRAKLRAKHGRVDISGSATVGWPDQPGNTVKETLDGTYVSDGYGGNKGASSVYSDNGPAHGYDLGEGVVTFPVIDSGTYTANNGVTYSNYLAYLQANATVVSGDLVIRYGTPLSVTGPKGSITIDASGNMTISGIVYVTGNISFEPKQKRITYSGKGTLVTPNSVFVHCDLMPRTNFPRTDALGLIARDRIELATGGGDSQLTMAIAMYAQHQIISSKQNQIAGTMVSSYFSMTNVPKLYQVPELADNLPPGMPGGDPIYVRSITVESWQEI
ncbi:MAG: hypothetical protein QHI38_08410 [Armatimonadota bacterium]|nr:hypothetical protein [Armatimonadota bacterium]